MVVKGCMNTLSRIRVMLFFLSWSSWLLMIRFVFARVCINLEHPAASREMNRFNNKLLGLNNAL